MNARSNFSAFDAGFDPEDTAVAHLRVPPHSVESEGSVIGALLLDNGAWDRISDLLTDTDFYRAENRLIFHAIASLVNASRGADVVTVFEHLQRHGKAADAGGLAYINELAQYLPSPANIRRYAEIVREKSILRQLVTASDEIATAAFNPGDKTAAEVLDGAQQAIFGLSDQGAPRDDWQSSDDGVVEVLDGIQTRADGEDVDFTPTGLKDLDDKLNGGMRPGQVLVIAGRPSMGKTALALSIGEHVGIDQGKPVGVLSMEMPKTEVQNRRVSMRSHIPFHKILRPERMNNFEWGQLTAAVEIMRQTPVYVSDQTALTINQVRSKARALKRRHGLGLLVIDYIGLMEGTDRRANRATQLGEVSRGIKALAKELGVPVLLLAQLNREVEKRPGMRPILADLRECGDIEQDADVILFVHRPFHVKPELGPEWKPYAELVIGKNRSGTCGVVDAMYVGETMHFVDWQGEKPTSLARTKGADL
ncbi:MAG: replicative DNA helicase [Hydrogenophaga sp.]|uniref:replicative DNA helicase n=1 Tax=Hydrogenophaga sp. TaxID=1904254 RepID=UPI002732757C|nr:replicative DNA helicase [Hydrogenophaga sp.]MDP3351836.1 replicative DNA helicase [Hydrogenophaga sp.]